MAKGKDILPFVLLGGGFLAALTLLKSDEKKTTDEPKKENDSTTPPASNESSSSSSSTQTVYKGADDYIKRNWQQAKDVTARTKVPTLTIIAHSGIESGWGKHAPKNNFFGIKAGKAWKGQIQKLKTFECGKTGNAKTDRIGDEIISIHAPNTTGSHAGCNKKNYYTYRVYGKFRAYDSPRDSFNDYANFLMVNSRYKEAFKYTNDPKKFAVTIMQKGYGTAPAYQELIQKVIDNVAKIAKANGLT